MSTNSSQFMNDVLLDSDKEMKHKANQELTIWNLKKEQFLRFRINSEHGIICEMLVPILFHYVIGTFNTEWFVVQNLLLVYAVVFFGYFRFQTQLGPALFWLLSTAVTAYLYLEAPEQRFSKLRVIHFLVLALNFELIPRFLPQQFSVSELFIFCSINAFYTTFGLDGLLDLEKKKFIAGCNISNVYVFAPWYILNFSGVAFVLLHRFILKTEGNTHAAKIRAFGLCLALGIAMTCAVIHPFLKMEFIVNFIDKAIIQEGGVIILYMASVLALGTYVITSIEQTTPTFILRKCFHGLAFVLFMPAIAQSKLDRPRLMVLAFNCVTIFLIFLEILRHSECLSPATSKWFKEKSSGRERMRDTFIATHIWLLMGCAFPLCASYTLFDGGVIAPEWALWSCAGIVFLGIGDSAAAILGKRYGRKKWRELSSKTQEGSSYCVISSTAAFFFLMQAIDPAQLPYFACFLFAAIPSAVLEGCTMQYDNLVCSIFYFTCIIFLMTVFSFDHQEHQAAQQ